MRLVIMRAAAASLLIALAACASPGPPPGGPEDPDPPELVAVTPDTMATGTSPRAVVFRFNEVVSERPQGATTLGGLFLISPRDGAPEVDWNRTALTVRPRRGWRRNTAYTVTMLPGLVDLRGNVRREGAVATFSTGPSIPRTSITGQVFDWAAGVPAQRALVEAISRPDSVVYIALADSAGRFRIPHAPPGAYTVRAFLDANNNRGFDERELWDSARVVLTDSTRLELLAFSHDTIGPRISEVSIADSLTLRVTFDRPIDPAQTLAPAIFALTARDSTLVPIRAVRSAREWDQARSERGDSAVVDSVRRPVATPAPAGPRRGAPPAPRDSADSAARTARPSRPSPIAEIVIELGRPLQPGGSYRLQATAVRGLQRTPRTSERAFNVPERPAATDSVGRGARPATPPAPRR